MSKEAAMKELDRIKRDLIHTLPEVIQTPTRLQKETEVEVEAEQETEKESQLEKDLSFYHYGGEAFPVVMWPPVLMFTSKYVAAKGQDDLEELSPNVTKRLD